MAGYANVYDDTIDLRDVVRVLWDNRWLILMCMAAAISAAVLANMFIIPSYESTIVLSVPKDIPGAHVENASHVYKELAGSSVVATHVAQAVSPLLHEPATPQSVLRRLDIRYNEKDGFLRVVALGPTPEASARLINAWYDAFVLHVEAYFAHSLAQRVDVAKAILDERALMLEQMREELIRFDAKYSLALMEADITALEEELATSNKVLRDLTLYEVPKLELQVQYFEESLADRTMYFDQHALPLPVHDDGAAQAEYTVVNPTYLFLEKELLTAEGKLLESTHRQQTILREKEALEQSIVAGRGHMLDLRETRTKLMSDVTRMTSLLYSAMAAHDEQIDLQDRLQTIIQHSVVNEPLMPHSPVAPRKMLNMAIALFLGGFVGVGIAFVKSMWQEEPADETRRGAADAQLPDGAGAVLP